MRLCLPLLALATACAVPAAALAHDHGGPAPDAGAADEVVDAGGRHFGHPMPPQPDEQRAQWEADRTAWLDECRARMDRQDEWYDGYGDGWRRKRSNGVTGAVLGGVAGGLAGRGIAGRGDKAIGTVAGAAVGAVAGAAIERAASSGGERHESRRSYSGDYCEQYFNYYTQQGWGQGWGYPGHGMAMMMVPVMPMHGQHGSKDCKETVVTEEWVTVRRPGRVRYISVPDKRVRTAPTKRVPMK